MMSPIVVAVIGAVVTAFLTAVVRLLISYRRWQTSPLRKLPGPKQSSFWIGEFLTIQRESFLQPHKRWWEEAGVDVPLISYSSLFGRYSVLLLDADLIKQVLTAPYGHDPPLYEKRFNTLRYTIGNGLVTLEGSRWHRHRRIIQPSFGVDHVKGAVTAAVLPRVKRLIDSWTKAGPDREIDASSHMSVLTLDVLGEVGFSHEFHAVDRVVDWANEESPSSSRGDEKVGAVDDPLVLALNGSLVPNFLRSMLISLDLPKIDSVVNPKTRRAARHLDAAVEQVVANARTADRNTRSFLQLLLDSEDSDHTEEKGLSCAEIRDEVKTLLVAGHETTSTWCYWALYALAKHPDVQERVYRDVIRHAPGDADIDLTAVEKMGYLSAFLQEVLRITPPVGIFGRTLTREEDFKGHRLPRGTRVLVSAHMLHRHPRYWEKPLEFLPERWLPQHNRCRPRNGVGATNGTRTKKDGINGGGGGGGGGDGGSSSGPEGSPFGHYFAFFPFSAGGRNCIGKRFATVEAKLIMAPIVRAFLVQLAPSLRGTEFTYATFITMKAKPALRICVRRREGPAATAAQ